MEIIFDQILFEDKIKEMQVLALTLNESHDIFNKYPTHVFAPMEEYLTQSFSTGIIDEGMKEWWGKQKEKADTFVDKFTKGAKEISMKIAAAVKEFSYKKIFATISKMMSKIKAKVLKSLMELFEPLRKTILTNKFCDENNKFSVKNTFAKLVDISKSAGKEVGAEALLNDKVVGAMKTNVNLEGTKELRESAFWTGISEADKEVATFDEKDVQFMGFFQKILFKLGVEDAKLNGFFATISKKVAQGAVAAGVMGIISALFPAAGIVTAIAGAAGAAVAAAPVLVMIIGAILFGIGLFMFVTWLLKPYPTVKNCEIFLATIFDGSNVFDYPEQPVELASKRAVSIKKLKKIKTAKPAFDQDHLENLQDDSKREELEINIPTETEFVKTKLNQLIKDYDDLDVDALEDKDSIQSNVKLVRFFVKNISKSREDIEDRLDDEDGKYAELLNDLFVIIDECADISETIVDENDEQRFHFPILSDKWKKFLRDGENSIQKRLAKVIDITDNFVDRLDKYLQKIDKSKKQKA